MPKMADAIVAVARRLSFIRETDGANRGLWVEFILRFTGNVAGESWCMAFVSLILAIVYRGKSPLLKTASCQDALTDARKKGYVTAAPTPGCLVFSVANGRAHHVAICTATPTADAIPVIAGNTSEDGKSSNGTGVFEHPVSRADKVYVQLPNAA